jgi:predicted RNA-binding Zn-ribbon protein involved in translation (DUF1610 family)
MRLTKKEYDAILTALAELLAGEGPQGIDDENEAQAIMDAAMSAQRKIIAKVDARRGTSVIPCPHCGSTEPGAMRLCRRRGR